MKTPQLIWAVGFFFTHRVYSRNKIDCSASHPKRDTEQPRNYI